MYFVISIVLFLAFVLWVAMVMVRENYDLYSVKNSSFECGFTPLSISRNPFSLRFFVLAVLFVVFDVEITMLIPMMSKYFVGGDNYSLSLLLIFILIMLLGLIHEWNEGSLEWVNS